MLLQSKIGRLESINGVTCRAFPTIVTLYELSPMRIWGVAIGALFESQWLVEVSAFVTRVASNRRMFS